MDRQTDRQADRQTDRIHADHVYVGLAQARPNNHYNPAAYFFYLRT